MMGGSLLILTIEQWAEAKRQLIADYGWYEQFDHEAFKEQREKFWRALPPESEEGSRE